MSIATSVLIYPEWIVNKKDKQKNGNAGYVLIYPKWIVNNAKVGDKVTKVTF